MLATLLIAGAVNASATPMNLAQAVAFAAAHSPTVLAARAQWVQAGATLALDRSIGLPLVQGVASNRANRESQSFGGNFAQLGLSPNPNFSQNTGELQGSQTIYSLQNALSANQARRSYDSAAQNYRLVREQATVNVETEYYGYVQDVDLVALAQSDLAYQRMLLEIANANYRAGRVAGIDRLKAQVQLTTSQENLASAQADEEDARENLAQLIGAEAGQPFVVVPAIPAPPQPEIDINALNTTATTRRPEVGVAQDNLASAILANGLVDAPNRPTIALQGGWGNQVAPTSASQTIAVCARTNDPLGCGATHFYTIGITSTWTLPLLDWGTNHAAHNGAHANIDAQSAALDAARRQALIDVDQAVRRLKVDEQNLALAGQNADVAKQAAQIAQVQYKVGLGSQIDVTTAEQTYLQAAKQLLAAQIGYVLAIDKLKLATGTLVAP